MHGAQAGVRPQGEERPWCVRHGSAGEPEPGQDGQREQHESETDAVARLLVYHRNSELVWYLQAWCAKKS